MKDGQRFTSAPGRFQPVVSLISRQLECPLLRKAAVQTGAPKNQVPSDWIEDRPPVSGKITCRCVFYATRIQGRGDQTVLRCFQAKDDPKTHREECGAGKENKLSESVTISDARINIDELTPNMYGEATGDTQLKLEIIESLSRISNMSESFDPNDSGSINVSTK